MGDLLYIALNLAGLVASIGVVVFWLRRYGTAALGVQPMVAFSVYFGLIHFFMPVYKNLSGKYRYPASYSDITEVYTAVVSLTVFCFVLILLRDPGRTYVEERFRQNQPHANAAFLAGLGIAAVGMFAMFMVTRQIDAIGYDVFRSDRILYSTQIGAFTRIDTIILPGVALLFAGNLNRPGRKLLSWIVFAGILFYTVRYYSMMQSRNSIILMFVTLGSVLFFYRNRPLRLSGKGRKTIAIGAVALALFGWLGYQITVSRYSGVDNWYAEAALDNILFTLLDGPFGNDENLLWLTERGHPYLWGQSYFAGFTNLIPRSIWPDKPWGAGPEIRNLIYPGSYVLGAEGNSSITTGFLTEARMNLGLAGILAMAALWAWIMRRMVRSLLRARTVFAQTMLIFSLSFLSTAFVYSEFLGFFSRLMVCLVVAVFCYSIIKILGIQNLKLGVT